MQSTICILCIFALLFPSFVWRVTFFIAINNRGDYTVEKDFFEIIKKIFYAIEFSTDLW